MCRTPSAIADVPHSLGTRVANYSYGAPRCPAQKDFADATSADADAWTSEQPNASPQSRMQLPQTRMPRSLLVVMATAVLMEKLAQRHPTKRSIPERNKHVNAIRLAASGNALQSLGWAQVLLQHTGVPLKVVSAKVTQAVMTSDPILLHELVVHVRCISSAHYLARNPLRHHGLGLYTARCSLTGSKRHNAFRSRG
jgi:hypothetical protein